MQVQEGIGHLVDVLRDNRQQDGRELKILSACAYPTAPPVGERPLLLKLLIKLSFCGELEHEENPFLVMEEPVKSQYVWVSKTLQRMMVRTAVSR